MNELGQLSKEEIDVLLQDASHCLKTAMLEETADQEKIIEIRASKSMFVKYYGNKLLRALGQLV